MPHLAARLHTAVVGGLGALLAIAGFALPFWWLLGRGQGSGLRTALAATLGTLWVLAVLAGVHRVERARAGRRDARRAAAQQADAERRAAEAGRRQQVLLADPRWAAFHPLIRRWRLADEAWLQAQEARYHALLADPRRAHHAPTCLDGARWSDAQLDYFDDPQARVTCAHLQPVEAGLREAGLLCWPQGAALLGTAASLQPDALRTRYALAPCVQERWEEEHPHAPVREFLHCSACGSQIESGHGAPFPAASS